MKKQILIALTIASATLIYGCSFAQVEKEPVVIEDTQGESSDNISAGEAESDATASEMNDQADKSADTLVDADKADDAGQNDTANNDSVNPNDPKNNKSIDPNDTTYNDGTNLNDTPAVSAGLPAASDEPAFYTIELEGMKEVIKVKTHDSDLGYIMLYDIERFTFAKEDGADLYYTENPNPDIYPFVYINILRVDDVSIKDYLAQRKDALSQQISNVQQFDQVKVGSSEAVMLKAVAGTDWNSVIRNMYFIQDGDSIIEIQTQYFLEAEEGYGARISALLDTFALK